MAYPQSVSGPDLGGLDDGVQDEARGVGGGATLLQLLGEELHHLRQEGGGGRREGGREGGRRREATLESLCTNLFQQRQACRQRQTE